MSPDLERLTGLQQLDSAIAEARNKIAAHPQRLAEADLRLTEADALVDVAAQRLKDNQEARRALEKDAALYQSRLTKFKDQLAAVKTNREFTAMQHEIETAQRELGVAEEKVLERMVEADGLTADVKKTEAARVAMRKAVEAEKAAMAADVAATEISMAQAIAARAALVAGLEPRLLGLFEQVAKARKGVALSLATRDGLCAECHVRLRPTVFQQARANNAIVQCDHCQRILYYVPPPPTTPAEPPAASAP
jgi:predicted  nucleic acid-binding Zn-ribbon protein